MIGNLSLKERIARLKIVIFDFDGVFTDGHVYVDTIGKETVMCSRKDGLGIEMLKKAGIKVAVISREVNQVVQVRCQKLKIPCYNAKLEKVSVIKEILQEEDIPTELAAFMGDDLNDLKALQYVGVRFVVSDCHPELREGHDYMTRAKGGDHAVREICEFIIDCKGVKKEIYNSF